MIELCLVEVFLWIIIFVCVCALVRQWNCSAPVIIAAALQSQTQPPIVESQSPIVESQPSIVETQPQPTVVETQPQSTSPSDSVLGGAYDEYDDKSTLLRMNKKEMDTFDVVIVDGNNFMYRYAEATGKSKSDVFTAEKLIIYMDSAIGLLLQHFPKKTIYFVFKDPETQEQTQDMLRITNTKKITDAHRALFDTLIAKYPNVKFVVAYGEDKYRDDYAAIWLSESVYEKSILLSRDRYKDVSEMSGGNIRFIIYGTDVEKIQNQINRPFNYITKGSVKANLVGYSFMNTKNSGLYDRKLDRKSQASPFVYIFNLKPKKKSKKTD